MKARQLPSRGNCARLLAVGTAIETLFSESLGREESESELQLHIKMSVTKTSAILEYIPKSLSPLSDNSDPTHFVWSKQNKYELADRLG